MPTLSTRARTGALARASVHVALLALCVGCSSNGMRVSSVGSAEQPASDLAPASVDAREPASVDARESGAVVEQPAQRPDPVPNAPPPSNASAPQEWLTPDGHYPNIYRRFGFSVGAAALQRFDTTLSVDSEVGVGALLDLEELLNVEDDSLVLRIDAHYAFNNRHRVDMTYYDVARNGEAALEEDTDVGEVTIPAGGVTTDFDTQIIKAAYRYNFVNDARTVIAFSAGFHVMNIDFAIASDVGQQLEETVAADLPLPVLGLHSEYALSHKWKLGTSAEFLQVDIGDFSGWIRDIRLGVDHDTFEHFGWGVGFNSFGLNAEVEDGGLTAEVDYGFQGFMIYLRTFF